MSRRRGPRTTRRDSQARPAPDRVERRFEADAPNRLWVADITYIPTLAGFLYLAIVLDVFSRRVVGWAMTAHLRTALVLEALEMAVAQRRPVSVIHHSDQGCQYTSLAFGARCREWGVAASMGSVGDCFDNAMAESFFATLECELLDRKTLATHAEARAAVFELGAALLRRRPKGLLPAARQELLDPSKAWWGGRRGRLADRPRYSISVSLGVVPLVLPRRGSPITHRGRGWLRSTRSFGTASAPTKLATRRIQTRAWMKQRYWVAPACTSELHHGRGPGTARPFDDAGGDGTQAPPCRRTRPRG